VDHCPAGEEMKMEACEEQNCREYKNSIHQILNFSATI
jgi:hypothetical protein